MDTFNIVAGAASIIGLLVAIFAVNKYINNSRKTNTKISQTAIGSNNKQKINFNGKS
jgi:hypothetical protein